MKLKVGDIEMDSQRGISFGEQSTTAVAHDTEPQPRQERDKTSLMARLPNWPRKAYLLAGALALAAAFGLGQLSGALFETGSALRYAPLIPVPGLFLAAGIAFWKAAFGNHQTSLQSPDDLAHRRSDRLADHLAGRLEPATVDELMDELEWRERAVVRALEAGVGRDLIVEDLDLDTGHWTYAAAPSGEEQSSRRALPIDERAKRLTSDE